jgi:hypothetical protein
MDAIERASRWKKLTVFFDEFQDIVENLDERDSRHLLGVLRAEIQRHTQVAYIFAGSARGSMLDIFTLAGTSPNDQQQLAYHLWTQSTPGVVDKQALRRAFFNIMGEIARRGETILDEATPAQRRVLFALALREGDEVAADSFIRFSGFTANGSVNAAMRPFLKGTNALLEKTGSRVRFRDRFVRLWLLVLLNRNPGMFPASRTLKESAEHRQLLTFIRADDE